MHNNANLQDAGDRKEVDVLRWESSEGESTGKVKTPSRQQDGTFSEDWETFVSTHPAAEPTLLDSVGRNMENLLSVAFHQQPSHLRPNDAEEYPPLRPSFVRYVREEFCALNDELPEEERLPLHSLEFSYNYAVGVALEEAVMEALRPLAAMHSRRCRIGTDMDQWTLPPDEAIWLALQEKYHDDDEQLMKNVFGTGPFFES